jgi:hypothetical protein
MPIYANAGAKFRADLSGVVVQTSDWEKTLIGQRVAPVVNVDAKDGQYPVFDKTTAGLLKRRSNIQRANSAGYARGSSSWSQDTYSTQEYGYEIPIDYNTIKEMSRFFSVEQITAMLAKRVPMLEHEIRVAAMTFNTSNYGAATNSGTAYTIANIASFDVGLDIDLSKERLRAKGESADGLSVVMSSNVFSRIRGSTKLQNRLRGIGIASDTILNLDEQAVAEALGVKEVLIGRNYYDVALENITFSGSAIWSDTYIWVGKLGTGGTPEGMLAGGSQFTLNWSQYGSVLNVFTYDQPEINSEIVRASHHVTEKVVNANQGDLIATQYS